MTVVLGSCTKDLNTIPLDDDEITAAVVYDNPASYKQVLAKLYAGLAVSGQEGPAGKPDITGIDEGFSTYLRQYWKAQELTTDEAIIAWNDGNLRDYHDQDWTATNEFVTAMYNRIYYQISLCNEFIRETTDEKLIERNTSDTDKALIEQYRAEARFLRAFSYWHALDMFRNVPFVTDLDQIGSFLPEQASANELFSYIESELVDLVGKLAEPKTNEYGRVDKAAAWMLLSKLYLNAEVYISNAKYTEAITELNKVISSGYMLDDKYQDLFLADNHTANGIIFPVTFDGINTRTWGGMTFIIHAGVGGNMDPAEFGIDGGWGGSRTTSAFVGKFQDLNLEKTVRSFTKLKSNYPTIYVPGDHNGWDPANETTILKSVNNDDNYEGYLYLTAAGGFKFTTGPNWDVNYGDSGADGTLDSGGDNISVAEDGFYKINVNLGTLTYTLTKTTWGVIGSATANGWDSDQDLTYDETSGLWTAVLDLGIGEIKFRANDGWDLNYGDTGANGILTEGGDNIAIATPGSYIVTLQLGAPDYTYSIVRGSFDGREMFHMDGQSLEITDIHEFTEGYAITKFKNITSTGATGSDLTFPDTDWPVFRLADAYLMYAEAVLRGGAGGDAGTALDYVNNLLERAYGDDSGNISVGELTLEFILDERARELYWEGHRRTDLIRFGQFSDGSYIWPWKGGIADGRSTSGYLDIFPIPSTDMGANPNLTQNPGY